ncbi:ShlB/FhaC/HecB family hemolysin secretion/activation protein [Sphingopyxis sp. R3-92]|uniref:ShlB/FhaC/HecB family hemolysin secretion/activation protein n=1 Tax=Sphingopyxis sp. R3-92 TaxID=3158553 RepID=UPI003EE65CD9
MRFDKNHWRLRPSAAVVAAMLCIAPVTVQAQDAAAQPAAASFDILAFQVKGNTLLGADDVERAILPFMGPGRSEADVEGARAALQKLYEDRGYVAVSVYIPEQSVDGGVLQLQVQPQAVGQLLVEGDTKNADAIRAMAPSVAVGTTPNMPAFQRDVVALNSNPSRRVTPELRAGEAPGTLDVVLKVEESSPFHASAELNNFSSGATTDLRASATLRYDNMWGRGDSLSLSAQTAPHRPDDGTVFSGNYLMRLGQGSQMLVYGVYSDSDIAVVGGTSVIGRGKMGGFRLIQSLGASEGFYHSLTLGMDYKDFSEDVLLGSDRASAPIKYAPLIASWRGDWMDDNATSSLTFSGAFGIRGLGDDWRRFDAKRYMARQSFIALKLDADTTRTFGPDLQLNARLTGQWSPDPLISNEGFSLGGMSSVRGYYESEAIGDYGFAYQTELRSPDLAKLLGSSLVTELRLHAFVDSGYVGIHQPLPSQAATRDTWLSSAGLGGRIKFFNYLTGAIDAGVPLKSGSTSESGDIFVRFRIQGEF